MSFEVHREMEDAHDKYAVRSNSVKDAMTLAIELPKCAGSAGNGAAEIGCLGNPLEQVLDG